MASSARLALLLLIVAAVGVGAACQRTPEEAAPAPAPATPLATAADAKPCAGVARRELAGRVRLRLVLGAGVDEAEARGYATAAADYWRAWGLEVEIAPELATTSLQAALEAKDEDIAAAVRALEARPAKERRGRPEDERMAAVATEVLRPLRGELTKLQLADLQIFVLPHVAAPESAAARFFTRLEAITLTGRAASASTSSDVATLWGALGDAAGGGVIVLSSQALRQRRPDAVDTALAHELGHAFGLVHHRGRHNLMTPKRSALCVPELDDEQVRSMRESVGAAEPAP
jgi:Zn-dependent protease with chaperone function